MLTLVFYTFFLWQQANIKTFGDPAWPPSWSSPTCKCIKNEDGKCMTLSRRGMPAYSRGLGINFQFLPNCVSDCMPGYINGFGVGADDVNEQTRMEISHCYVDWKRLRKANPQWSDPNWRP
jgi:hypothetical protein